MIFKVSTEEEVYRLWHVFPSDSWAFVTLQIGSAEWQLA